ncbi:MAG: hypothetical protein U9N59_00010 [Campylobacterota bacterium]|nr:hypothetical protein [Campylobacterota bacterium]
MSFILLGCSSDQSKPIQSIINVNLDNNDTNNTNENENEEINIPNTNKTVYVERGAVYLAIVKDSDGNYAVNTPNTNIYNFEDVPTYPIYASSGWIDIDNDNNKTLNDVVLDLNLSSYSNNITPVTTLLSESNTTRRAAIEVKLFELFGINNVDLYKLPSVANNDKLEELTNALYKLSKEYNKTINNLFNYDTLIIESNSTLEDEVFKLSLYNYSGSLETYLYEENSSLFTNIKNIGTLDYKEITSTSDIEDIWNISLEVNSGIDYDSFNIGVRFIKSEDDGSDDMGDFVYKDISIRDDNITAPSKLDIYGYGDNKSGGTNFSDSYDPDNVREGSISLENGILKLNLGYVMKNQTAVSESRFKIATDYDIKIVSTKPIFKYSKTLTLKLIYNEYDFINAQGVTGEIKIK